MEFRSLSGLMETDSEGLKESGENIIGSWRKGNLDYALTQDLAVLWPGTTWKTGYEVNGVANDFQAEYQKCHLTSSYCL